MCGIVGIVTGQNNQYSISEIINSMARKIIHRGPDHYGFYFDKDLSFCFAYQRLSILDLSKTGNQPMESYNKRYLISFNGEIYNFKELKNKLNLNSNIKWNGNSDTEVLINAIETWGLKKTLNLCIGMFAFALLDRKEKKLFLVRDRFGEKPIYWGLTGTGSSKALIFGSDLVSFKEFPSFNNEINLEALDAYLKFSYIPSELTIYKSVKKLKAGYLAEFNLDTNSEINRPKISKWWDYEKTNESGISKKLNCKKDILSQLEKTLKEATNKCSVSDVPVGCFLSGGTDSSLIASLLASDSNSQINTFTIGFEDKNYDESFCAKKVADYIGSNHQEIILEPNEALNLISDLPRLYSEPFADQSQIPTALICRETQKRGIKVALTGDGGDEIFGGYIRHFKGSNIWSKLKLIPYPIRSSIGSLFESIPHYKPSEKNPLSKYNYIYKKINKMAFRLKHVKSSDDLYRSLVMQNIENSIYSKSIIKNFSDPFEGYYASLNECPNSIKNDPVSRMLYWDAISYLQDDILVKVDRASMGYSLETRTPFLDKNVVELAWKIPTKMKVKNGSGKLILKELLCKYLPEKYVYRPKQGFGLPIDDWIRGSLKEWSEDLLFGENIRSQDYFSIEYLKIIWDQHLNQGIDNSRLLWPILMWQSWSNFYL